MVICKSKERKGEGKYPSSKAASGTNAERRPHIAINIEEDRQRWVWGESLARVERKHGRGM